MFSVLLDSLKEIYLVIRKEQMRKKDLKWLSRKSVGALRSDFSLMQEGGNTPRKQGIRLKRVGR